MKPPRSATMLSGIELVVRCAAAAGRSGCAAAGCGGGLLAAGAGGVSGSGEHAASSAANEEATSDVVVLAMANLRDTDAIGRSRKGFEHANTCSGRGPASPAERAIIPASIATRTPPCT